jgi:hypothetical protein
MDNNPFVVGDIVEDHSGKVKVESIGYWLSESPCAIYNGIELNKNGSESKKGKRRAVFQCNLLIYKNK